IPQNHSADIAWEGIVQYRHAARRQIVRVTQAIEALKEARAAPRPDPPDPDVFQTLDKAAQRALVEEQFAPSRELARLHEEALTEIHFYFICWYQIARRVAVLANGLKIPALVQFAKDQHAFRLD